MAQVSITFAPAETLRSQLTTAGEDAAAHAADLRALGAPEVPLGVALLVLDGAVVDAESLRSSVDGVIRAMRLIDDGGPSASGELPFGTLDEAARSRLGEDLAAQAEEAIEEGDGERLAEIVRTMNTQGEDEAWAFWQALGTDQVHEALDVLAIEDEGGAILRSDFFRLLAAGDRAGAFTEAEQQAVIGEVRESVNGTQFAYDLLIEQVGAQEVTFSDDFTYLLIEHAWAAGAYIDHQIDVLGAAEGRPELAIRLLDADPGTWGDWVLGEDLAEVVDTPTVAESIFTNEVFDEPGTALIRTLLDSDADLAGRDGATLVVVRVVGSDDADFTDAYRPMLADLYGQYREDFTEGVGLHPYEGAQTQLEGRDGIELGGSEIRTYLAEVALDDEAWDRVTEVTGQEQARLSAMVGEGDGLGERGNDASVFRTSGLLQGLVLQSRNDALMHQGESAAERREDLVAGLDAIVKAGQLVANPAAGATSLATEYGPDLVAQILVPDGDVAAPTDPISAVPGANAESFRTEFNGVVADVEAGSPGEEGVAVNRQIVAEAEAYNATLPADERFLDADGTIPSVLTDEQQAHLLRWATGVPGSGETTFAGTFDEKHPAGTWLQDYAQEEPATSDNV